MADSLPPNPAAEAEKVKQHNAQIAAQLEEQGRQEYSDASALDDTSGALDALAQGTDDGGDDGNTGGDEGGTGGDEAGTGAGDEGGEEGSAKPNEGGEGGTEGGEEGGAEGGAEGGLVEKKDEGDEGGAASTDGGDPSKSGDNSDTSGDDPFKDDALPDTATPKSAEAFESVKNKARETIAERDAKITELTSKVTELEEKTKNALPPETAQELEELRKFRAKLDVEADPQFKTYDEKISSASEFVYAQMTKAGIGNDVIDEIKKMGGPHKIKLEKIYEVMEDPQAERLINSKVADIEESAFNKQQAIEKAKGNIDEYLQEQNERVEKGASQHREVTQGILDKEILPKFDFFKEPEPLKADASEDDKKLHAARREWLANAKEQVQFALSDDSPQMRAILVGGVVKMLHLENMVRGSNAIIAGKDKEIESLTKELKEAKELSERLTKGSVSRRDKSNAGSAANPKPGADFDPNQTTDDALESLARSMEQQRRSAGVS